MSQTVTKDAIIAQAQGHEPASQSTHIEQSRAIAQVQGALVVARGNPRDEIMAMERIRQACGTPGLAARAFFRYSRGGSQVTGPSIHFATELARCWGNVEFGISELRRDDVKGESEMVAVAWDLETNARVTNAFIVPHKRDKRGGAVSLTDMRDIYENNANQGARRLRECILRLIPTHVKEEATQICYQTLEDGGGEPLHQRREKLLEAFAGINVTRAQIEKRTGRSADKLTAADIAPLRIIYQSIVRGEINAADEFPSDQAADVQKSLTAPQESASSGKAEQPPATAKASAEPPPPQETASEPASEPPAEQAAMDLSLDDPGEEPKEDPAERKRIDYFEQISQNVETIDNLQELEISWGKVKPHFETMGIVKDDDWYKKFANMFATRKVELAKQ